MLIVVSRARCVVVFCVGCCSLFVVSCCLSYVCCCVLFRFAVRGLWFVVRCLLFLVDGRVLLDVLYCLCGVGCFFLFGVWCLVIGCRCLAFACLFLFVVRCLFGVSLCASLFVVCRRLLFVVGFVCCL